MKIDVLCESEGRPLAMWQVRSCKNRMTSQVHFPSVNCQRAVNCQQELQLHSKKASHLKCLNISNFTETSGYAVSRLSLSPTSCCLKINKDIFLICVIFSQNVHMSKKVTKKQRERETERQTKRHRETEKDRHTPRQRRLPRRLPHVI